MNREIKFRAFIDGKMKPISVLHNTPHPSRTIDMDFETMHVNAVLLPVETPVMQYTGLKDKQGNEIYESDIIKVFPGEFTSVVKWQDSAFHYIWDNYCTGEALSYVSGACEVIGNIHENHELIKQ